MKQEDINRCQIQEWFPKFKSLSLKTIIHELPESFVEYLTDDSGPFLIPLSVTNEDAMPKRIYNSEEEEDFVVSEGSGNEAEETAPPPSFPQLEREIVDSIDTLGGAVFPKLNWSAPKDAAWMSSTGNLKCTKFTEIALLLRSSDSVVHDLYHAYDSCTDKTASRPSRFFLALRKWYPSLHPEMEFRCFVRGKVLVGVCQREVSNFYPVLVERKRGLKRAIEQLFVERIKDVFESESYTFDVYVTKDGRVKVLDFNPWGVSTLPLMFTWEELEEMSREEGKGHGFEFRIVESRLGIRPGLKTAVPYDYLDTSEGSGWAEVLRNADEELRKQTSSHSEAGA